jgi:hypothetical protein
MNDRFDIHLELPLVHFTLQYDYAKKAAQILNVTKT